MGIPESKIYDRRLKMATKIKIMDSKWIVLISVVLVVLIWVGVSRNQERIRCLNAGKTADAAFSEGNYTNAELYYHDLAYGDCPARFNSSGVSFDQLRLGELQSYNLAVREIEHGAFYSAIQTLQIYLEYPRELQQEAELLLSEAYQLLSQDTGQDGAKLMQDMYGVSCGLNENSLLPVEPIVSPETAIHFWYPGAMDSNSSLAASMPAEFHVAVCYQLIDIEVVETCLYNQSGTLGAGVSQSVARKNAVYQIALKDTLTGETIATYQPVSSKTPGACPPSMTGATTFTEIIGEPNFSTAVPWIEEQLGSLK